MSACGLPHGALITTSSSVSSACGFAARRLPPPGPPPLRQPRAAVVCLIPDLELPPRALRAPWSHVPPAPTPSSTSRAVVGASELRRGAGDGESSHRGARFGVRHRPPRLGMRSDVAGFSTVGSKFLSIARRAWMVNAGDNEVYTGSGLQGVIPYVQYVAVVFRSQVCS
jgi:hypothetical protein